MKGISIKEVIENNIISESLLVAGRKGIDRESSQVIVLETPDGLSWLKGQEIVLTAGYAFINNPEMKDSIIEQAAQKGIAAIAIKTGRYFGDISKSIINQADKYNVPLFLLSREMVYSEIIESYYNYKFDKDLKYLKTLTESYNQLLLLSAKHLDQEYITREVGKITGLDISIERILDTNEKKEENIYFNINSNDLQTYLVVKNESSINEFQRQCIGYSLNILESLIKQRQSILLSQSLNNRMMTEILLNQDEIDDRYLYSVNNYLDWENEPFKCIYFFWKEDKNKANHLIRKLLEIDFSKKFLFASDKSSMAVFASEKNLNNIIEDIVEKIPMSKEKLKISISSEFSSLINIKTAYDEAKNLNFLSNDFIIDGSDIQDVKLFTNILADRNLKEYLTSIINPLLAYDKSNATELFLTLQTYIDNNLNKTNTSKQMHIHVETLRYRLKKISELTNRDLNNSKDMMYFMLALLSFQLN